MTFIDTNVLVYAVDGKEKSKQPPASEIVTRAIDGDGFLVSAQVLNEFANIALGKLKMTVSEVWHGKSDQPVQVTPPARRWRGDALCGYAVKRLSATAP